MKTTRQHKNSLTALVFLAVLLLSFQNCGPAFQTVGTSDQNSSLGSSTTIPVTTSTIAGTTTSTTTTIPGATTSTTIAPPPPPPVPAIAYTGKITSFALPAIATAPYTTLRGSKHTNMSSDGKRIYVSGGDWVHSATDGTWSMDLTDGSWRQDVGDPVYPTLPAPHALQDGAGFVWVAAKAKFLLWPGSYYPYEVEPAPILNYAKGMWWFDPVTNTYTQELGLFSVKYSGTGNLFGGVYDDINEHILSFGDSSSGNFSAHRWDVKSLVKLPDIGFSLTPKPGYATYFTRGMHAKIGRDVYILGYRTNGNVSSQEPLMLRWNLDTHIMQELSAPPVDGTIMRDLEIRLGVSHGKLVWPFMTGPEGDLVHGIYIYDPTTGKWYVDNQVPTYGNFIGNAVTSLSDGRVVWSGGAFGKLQTHIWFYEAL